MALYVGGNVVIDDDRSLNIKEMSNERWGGFIRMEGTAPGVTYDSRSTAAHGSAGGGSGPSAYGGPNGKRVETYAGLQELVRGYSLSGYKSGTCCDDVNRVQYVTDTNSHVGNITCRGNYNRGGSAPAKGGMSWAACGCQTSSASTRLFTFSTETISNGPDKANRSNNGSFDWEGMWRCYTFAGNNATLDMFDWSNDTYYTKTSSPHSQSSDISWMTHHYGYVAESTGDSTNYWYNFAADSWGTVSHGGGGQTSLSGSVCPAWSCLRMGTGMHYALGDEGKGYSPEHGGSNQLWKMNVTAPGSVTYVGVGGWPGRLTPYNSEVINMNGNRHSRFNGAYNGGSGQHTYGGKVNNYTDTRQDVPSLDGVSDVSGLSSGVGICSLI